MPPLEDAEIGAKLCDAFKDRTSGGVEWKPLASEWIRKNLEATPDEVGDLLYEHLVKGGKVQQVKEDRPEYRHREYHYDFVIIVESKNVYVETVLTEKRMGPVVTIVNTHWAQ
jgi:hypothetical protein